MTIFVVNNMKKVAYWNQISYVPFTVQYYMESRCYVQLDFVRQFKSELVRRQEGVVFEKKKFIT